MQHAVSFYDPRKEKISQNSASNTEITQLSPIPLNENVHNPQYFLSNKVNCQTLQFQDLHMYDLAYRDSVALRPKKRPPRKKVT